MTTPTVSSSKKGRSPSYPGINLEEALNRAEQMRAIEQRAQAPVDVILQHWGYKPKSGGGLVALAALIKFGLLTDEGSGDARKARLTQDALWILMDRREDSTEKAELIRAAALRPPIHRNLWDHYEGKLPSDATLRHFLIFDRAFTESGADEFIAEFRATIEFASLTPSDRMSPATEDKADSPDPAVNGAKPAGERQQQPLKPGVTAMQIPIAIGEYATLEAAFPMTEAKWNQMLEVLKVFKAGLVAPEVAPPGHHAPGASPSRATDTEEGLTAEAERLILKVEQGGVPAFMTPELERIAGENGVAIVTDMTPNDVIQALKDKL